MPKLVTEADTKEHHAYKKDCATFTQADYLNR